MEMYVSSLNARSGGSMLLLVLMKVGHVDAREDTNVSGAAQEEGQQDGDVQLQQSLSIIAEMEADSKN
jgi:hypothetical protein